MSILWIKPVHENARMPVKCLETSQSGMGKGGVRVVCYSWGSLLLGALYLLFAKRVVVHKLRLKRTPLLADPNLHR
jgi:hypothetical protein